jgi:hypothetical protein
VDGALRPATLGLLALAGAAALWAGPAAAREERVVAIGSVELTVALADGDCFFDPEQPADRALMDQLEAATGPAFVPLLAFGACDRIAGWRTGDPPALRRFGYVMIAETHLEPVFGFDQPALADAIAKALADQGVADYRADIARLAADLEAAWTAVPPGGKRDLGVVHRDRYGPVQAAVLSVAGPDGRAFPRIMLHQSVLLHGKVLSVVALRDYRDQESIFEAYGDLSAVVEATAARNAE